MQNIIKNQNPIELLFKDVKHFNAQNPVIGFLIREVDVGRKKDRSKFLDKAPNIRDLELRTILNKLRNGREFFNRGDNNNNSNSNDNNGGNVFLLPPPSLPHFDFSDETGQRPLPNIESFLNNFPHPTPPPPLLPPFVTPDITARRKNDSVTNTTQTMSGDRLIGQLEQGIEKEKTKKNLVPEEDIVFALPKIPEILDNEDFEQKQEIKNNKNMK